MPFGAVARYLRPLPEGDFRRRKVEDAETLTAFALENQGEALVELIESLGEDVSVSAIKAGLVDVVPDKNWTSWWNKARKHPRILTSGNRLTTPLLGQRQRRECDRCTARPNSRRPIHGSV